MTTTAATNHSARCFRDDLLGAWVSSSG